MSMEFAWNTQKNKITDIKGKEKEQEREGKITNEEIDLDKTHLNYDLVESNKNLYQRVKDRVEEVRSVSRIQKNSVVDYSNIITVPKDQAEEWGIEKSKEYLKEVYNYFCNEFGKENIVSAKVHLDETAPHMHLHFVPVNKENGKLQARVVMTKERINRIHTEAPKYLQEKGYDVVRGSGKTENSLDIHKYKAEKLKEEIHILEKQFESFKSIEGRTGDIDVIEVKESLMGSKVTVSKDDYERLVELAKQGIYNTNKIKSLERAVNELEGDNKELKNIRYENRELKDKVKQLSSKVNKANKIIASLSPEFKEEFLKAKDLIENKSKAPKVKTNNNQLVR